MPRTRRLALLLAATGAACAAAAQSPAAPATAAAPAHAATRATAPAHAAATHPAGRPPVGAWGRQYLYAVELVSADGVFDGAQRIEHGDGTVTQTRVHATARFRKRSGPPRRGVTYAYYSDLHARGHAPYGAIEPLLGTLRWEGRVSGSETPPAADGEPARTLDCPLRWEPSQASFRGAWRAGGPLRASIPLPQEIDDCGMQTQPAAFGLYASAETTLPTTPALLRRRVVQIPIRFHRRVPIEHRRPEDRRRYGDGYFELTWSGAIRLRRTTSCPLPTGGIDCAVYSTRTS